MEKNESSCSILHSLKLDDIEETLTEANHEKDAGRPPRKPIGSYGSLIKDAELEDIEEHLSKIEQEKESKSHPKEKMKE